MPWMSKKRSSWPWHFWELDALLSTAVNLVTSTVMTAALSPRHNLTPLFHHRLWYWRWSWGRLWLVVWVPCRQKREGPSGRRSAVLAQISQKCVSCSNCPKKALKGPYDSPTMSQTSWIVSLWSARLASRTLAMFSCDVLVDNRPERSSSSTEFRPSLKRLYHGIISEGFL